MTAHSSVLAWSIPGAGEPGGLPSMGPHRIRHERNDSAAAAYTCLESTDIFTFSVYALSMSVHLFRTLFSFSSVCGVFYIGILYIYSFFTWVFLLSSYKWCYIFNFDFCLFVAVIQKYNWFWYAYLISWSLCRTHLLIPWIVFVFVFSRFLGIFHADYAICRSKQFMSSLLIFMLSCLFCLFC